MGRIGQMMLQQGNHHNYVLHVINGPDEQTLPNSKPSQNLEANFEVQKGCCIWFTCASSKIEWVWHGVA
jgi:hypothetical protein